jgi:hypothetical protein
MNRQERRAAAANRRKWEVGTVVETQGFRDGKGQHYWFERPEGWTTEDGMPEGVEIHGPFKTEAKAYENQRLILLGPQCEVIEGGRWDSAWDRLQ